jgi:hypothetical protein
MAAEIITKEDLQEFGEQLLNQMKALISGGSTEEPRKFLKSYQVKNLLKISNNTLQTLRDNGTIPFTKNRRYPLLQLRGYHESIKRYDYE